MSLVSQLPALLGVVVGGSVSWGATALNERSRFRRDQASTLQAQRLAAYSDFSAATKQTLSLLYRVGSGLGVDDNVDPLTIDGAGPLLAAAFHERETAFERLHMVAGQPVIDAARRWVRGVHDLRACLDLADLDEATWRRHVARANDGREEFYRCARADINLVEG